MYLAERSQHSQSAGRLSLPPASNIALRHEGSKLADSWSTQISCGLAGITGSFHDTHIIEKELIVTRHLGLAVVVVVVVDAMRFDWRNAADSFFGAIRR